MEVHSLEVYIHKQDGQTTNKTIRFKIVKKNGYTR